MLTFWDDTAAIQRFAGDDYIEMEPHAHHYNLYSAAPPGISSNE